MFSCSFYKRCQNHRLRIINTLQKEGDSGGVVGGVFVSLFISFFSRVVVSRIISGSAELDQCLAS